MVYVYNFRQIVGPIWKSVPRCGTRLADWFIAPFEARGDRRKDIASVETWRDQILVVREFPFANDRGPTSHDFEQAIPRSDEPATIGLNDRAGALRSDSGID